MDEIVPLWMISATIITSFIGFIGNALILISTYSFPQLQSRCGLLIGTLALSDLIICSYLIELRILQLFNWFDISNRDCFLVSIHGLFCLSLQTFMGLSLGIDRLMAVTIPIRYKMLPSWVHILLIGMSLIYATVITGIGAYDMGNTIVRVCMPPTAFNNLSRLIWIGSSFTIGIFTLFIYGNAQFKCARMGRSVERTNRTSYLRLTRMLNSLTLVVIVYTLTWFLTVCSLFVTQLWTKDSPLSRIIEQHLVWLVIINASTNVFIYSWRSPEYRRAFVSLLCLCGRGINEDGNTDITRTTTFTGRKISLMNQNDRRLS